ncbi:hypothetical protein [Dickeya fangzhongdai]|uniref:hypothetical protein n=1 Tax=Dickeya fangzhongdai TaxID=1778540 RepID=UPI00142DD306|nr:hypothetical protein [Dickeya fangzhongdai]GGB97721.1 hypothetical protein GCM10007171_13520 [Dickeya fangzhongdai]
MDPEVINKLLADYADISSKLATYIGERDYTEEEQEIMDVLIRIHTQLTEYSSSHIS